MKYWEMIARNLSALGWSWGMTTVYDANAGTLYIVDAHSAAVAGRFIVQADNLLTAFVELEQVARQHCRP